MNPSTVTQTQIETTISIATQRIVDNAAKFGDLFPYAGDELIYVLRANDNWTAGFWPGLLWLAFNVGGAESVRDLACNLLSSFKRRLNEQIVITHDLGFLFTLSAKAQWQLTQDEKAKEMALRAADELWARYRPAGKYIQAWGPVGDKEQGGRIIMDTMMNLPLLYWASHMTGNTKYAQTANDHTRATLAHLIRSDSSSNHTFYFDQVTGEPLYASTHQGYADDSHWARGQAWGVYGIALAAEWSSNPEFLQGAVKVADRFWAELPEDLIAPWDFRFPAGAPTHLDSSANAIAACGYFRLAQLIPEKRNDYINQGLALIAALTEHCWEDHPQGQGLLRHGAMHVPKEWYTDSYIIFGDYYFYEALLTAVGRNPDFWGPPKQNSILTEVFDD